jgi:hypothetical protein
VTDGKCGRNADGTFGAGNAGKPRGTRHKATQAVMALLEGEAEALSRKAIDMALAGDTVALRLCLERVAPARKDNAVEFALPRMTSAKDAAEAAGAVLQAVSTGEVTPVEAAQIMGLIDVFRRVLEVSELETRIAALEGHGV